MPQFLERLFKLWNKAAIFLSLDQLQYKTAPVSSKCKRCVTCGRVKFQILKTKSIFIWTKKNRTTRNSARFRPPPSPLRRHSSLPLSFLFFVGARHPSLSLQLKQCSAAISSFPLGLAVIFAISPIFTVLGLNWRFWNRWKRVNLVVIKLKIVCLVVYEDC